MHLVKSRREEKDKLLEELREKRRHENELKEAAEVEKALLKKLKHEKILEVKKKIDPMEIYTEKLMEKVIESKLEADKKKKEQ